MTQKKYSDLHLIVRMLRIARPYRFALIALLLMSMLAAPLALLMPLPIKIAIDSVLGDAAPPRFLTASLPERWFETKESLLWLSLGLIFCVALLQQTRDVIAMLLREYCGQSLTIRMRSMLFSHVQRLSLAFHDERRSAESLYRIQSDAVACDDTVVKGVIPMLGSLTTLLVMIIVVLRLDWLLTLVALAICPFLLVVSQVFRPALRSRWNAYKESDSLVLELVQESLAMIRVVVAFGRESREQARFIERSMLARRRKLLAVLAEGLYSILLAFTIAAGTAGVLFVGVRHVLQGRLLLGDLMLVLFYLAMVYQPLQALANKASAVQSALAGAARTFSVLDARPDVVDKPGARSIEHTGGGIEFRGVSFSYNETTVLSDISFRVAPGTRVGILGPTGAGKSTLLSLLPRFYDPTAGQVFLDGVDLRDYKLTDLREQFALVLQDTALVSMTLAENIAYGRPDASREEIIRAAQMANAHDFIMQTPRGYDTEVGERGTRLSGGERQRIALARAFLRNAPILILDEPTSAVDSATEGKVLDAMERLMHGRTTFIISHSLGALDKCDTLLYIEAGRINPERSRQSQPTLS
jgi:ATP-binding cassette subfamily B protein